MSTFFAKSFHQASYFRWAWNCSFLNGRNSFLYLSKFIWALEKLLRTLSSDKKHFMQKKWNENKIIKSTKMVELKKNVFLKIINGFSVFFEEEEQELSLLKKEGKYWLTWLPISRLISAKLPLAISDFTRSQICDENIW